MVPNYLTRKKSRNKQSLLEHRVPGFVRLSSQFRGEIAERSACGETIRALSVSTTA